MTLNEPRSTALPIASRLLNDGGILEIVQNPDTGDTSFLHFEDGKVTEQKSFELPGVGHVVPFSSRNNLLTHRVVLLPSAATDYTSESLLLAEVRRFIRKYADLSEAFEEVASLYVLLSWVYDHFTVVPYLRLKGDYGTGKSRSLQVIGSLCYRPMFVSGASTVSPMFRIIDAFQGTLILDESDFRLSDDKAEIVKILNNGNAVGFPVLRSEATPTKEFNPRAFTVFGPKVIATRRDFEDQALESRCITEVMTGLPPRAEIPLALPPSFDAEARALRDQLLMYRFRNFPSMASTAVNHGPDLEARVAQVFAPLLAVALDDASRARLTAIATKQTKVLRSDRSVSIEAQLLDTINDMRAEGAALQIRDITARFAERFGADYDRPVTARWIGSQLRKRLSLVPVKSHGTYLLPASEETKLRSLYRRYEIGSSSDSEAVTTS